MLRAPQPQCFAASILLNQGSGQLKATVASLKYQGNQIFKEMENVKKEGNKEHTLLTTTVKKKARN